MVYSTDSICIDIPPREQAPATRLFVNLVQNQKPGENSSTLFILPGGPGANSTHFASYRSLQDSMNLVFFDPRGCGVSDKSDPTTYSLNNYIDDIEAIRTALGIKKISVLGKSYSGLCALGYAIRYPEAVEKLILVATGPSYHFITTAKAKLAQIGTPAQIRASEKLWEGRFISSAEVEDYFHLMMPLYSTKASLEPVQEEKTLPFAHEPLNRGFLTDLRTVNFIDDLSKIICPTLVITGDSDWIFDQDYSKLMAKKIPNAELIIFQNAGHFIETDVLDDFYEQIRRFMI